jgi:hypothetical protein
LNVIGVQVPQFVPADAETVAVVAVGDVTE